MAMRVRRVLGVVQHSMYSGWKSFNRSGSPSIHGRSVLGAPTRLLRPALPLWTFPQKKEHFLAAAAALEALPLRRAQLVLLVSSLAAVVSISHFFPPELPTCTKNPHNGP